MGRDIRKTLPSVRLGKRCKKDREDRQAVEPVFGKIKHARGFRQFLLRGQNELQPNGQYSVPSTIS